MKQIRVGYRVKLRIDFFIHRMIPSFINLKVYNESYNIDVSMI